MRAVRTPEAIQRLLNKLTAFDYDLREAGREALENGAVAAVWSEADHLVKAEVNDDRRLDLTWFFTRGEWSCRCSCGTRGDCTHAYASGFAWITAVESGARDGRDPGDTLTPAPTRFTQAVTTGKEHALEAELARWLVALPSPDAEADAVANGFFADLHGLRVRLDNSGNWNIEIRRSPDRPWRAPAQKWLNDLARMRPADFEALPRRRKRPRRCPRRRGSPFPHRTFHQTRPARGSRHRPTAHQTRSRGVDLTRRQPA